MKKNNRLPQFDAEGVIDRSSPYRRTAQKPNATKKPHKTEETHQAFSVGFFLVYGFYRIQFESGMLFDVAFVLCEVRQP